MVVAQLVERPLPTPEIRSGMAHIKKSYSDSITIKRSTHWRGCRSQRSKGFGTFAPFLPTRLWGLCWRRQSPSSLTWTAWSSPRPGSGSVTSRSPQLGWPWIRTDEVLLLNCDSLAGLLTTMAIQLRFFYFSAKTEHRENDSRGRV